MSAVPVTILTGFPGARRTTSSYRILTEHHGRRIAVIEDAVGDIGVDQALVVHADEEVSEMPDGCVCCTRGDLIRVPDNPSERRARFDCLLVDTTSSPPVGQTVTWSCGAWGPTATGNVIGFDVCHAKMEAVAWRPDGRSLGAHPRGHVTIWRTAT